jgi:SAM-dependent methyltransferase
MISEALLDRLACPVCLEPTGCERCAARTASHESCRADYDQRIACGCGGPDKVRLVRQAEGLACPCCEVVYAISGTYVDLAPRTAVGDVTQYADHEFHERLGVRAGPPVLSARVKADMMRAMLRPAPGEALLDLGCGAGKLAAYATRDRVTVTGVDLAPFFLAGAAEKVDLVVGDLRRLPFRRGVFSAGYTLDVLEHVDEAGVVEILREARRALGPEGRLFVYTHAMESSRIAGFQRAVNRLARRLGDAGLIDHEKEALRKSDHVNAIQSHEHFDALASRAGFRVTERRYYNVFFKAVIEDLLLRLYEQYQARGRGPADAHAHPDVGEVADESAPAALPARQPSAPVLALAHVLTWLLKLDVVLFGGVRTGPFFGLLEARRDDAARP